MEIPFGSYVEAAQKTTNTAKARTRSAIYLGVSSNIQGGHEVMALDTGFELSSQKVTKLPISDVVIKKVEESVEIQSTTPRMRSKTRNKKKRLMNLRILPTLD